MIRIGLPKGRMALETGRFCSALGIQMRPGVLRYRTTIGRTDVSVLLLKAADVARLLRRNILDLGLTGDEWLLETGIPLDHRCFEARSYEASICLLMAQGDVRPLRRIRSVVTPYPNLARSLTSGGAPYSRIMAVSGSSEALVPDVADACIDLVETGSSAALNDLVVRRSFEHVTTHLVRSGECDSTAVAPIIERLAGAQELVR